MFSGTVLRVCEFVDDGSTYQVARSFRRSALPFAEWGNQSNCETADEGSEGKPPLTAPPAQMGLHYPQCSNSQLAIALGAVGGWSSFRFDEDTRDGRFCAANLLLDALDNAFHLPHSRPVLQLQRDREQNLIGP